MRVEAMEAILVETEENRGDGMGKGVGGEDGLYRLKWRIQFYRKLFE